LLTAGFARDGNKPVARGVVKLRLAGLALVQNLPLMLWQIGVSKMAEHKNK